MSRPERDSLQALQNLDAAIRSNNHDGLLQAIVTPFALQGRTAAEQVEFITKSLRDEISPAGIKALRKGARFGPLPELFPGESGKWSKAAGVKAEDCLAFAMEHNGTHAEVVLVRRPDGYRIVRCNNVKQMAEDRS